jgi:site-specific recombinase
MSEKYSTEELVAALKSQRCNVHQTTAMMNLNEINAIIARLWAADKPCGAAKRVRTWLNAFDPGLTEIVSRKFTQFIADYEEKEN